MTKKRVGVLRGGEGEHYTVSLQKGAELINHILENLSDRWHPVDIFIDKNGVWHMGGLPVVPADLVHRIDVAWNYTSPNFSQILNNFSIPNVSISPFSSTIAESREMLEEHMQNIGVKMPKSIVFPIYQKDFDGSKEEYAVKSAQKVFEKFSPPWIVRSYASNINMAVHVAKTFEELVGGILEGAEKKTSLLVEELIDGKVGAVHSLHGFRGDLPVQAGGIYVFPSQGFSRAENEKLAELSRNLHKHLGVNHYLKLDIVWHPKKGIYLTNINFSPNLKPGSHFDQSIQNVGAKMHQVVEHILENVLKK